MINFTKKLYQPESGIYRKNKRKNIKNINENSEITISVIEDELNGNYLQFSDVYGTNMKLTVMDPNNENILKAHYYLDEELDTDCRHLNGGKENEVMFFYFINNIGHAISLQFEDSEATYVS